MESSPHNPKDPLGSLLEALAFISRIFWGPTQACCAEMTQGASLSWALEINTFLKAEFDKSIQELKAIIRESSDADDLYQHLDEAYVRLFISAKGGIPAPLYQSCYEYENAPLMGPPAMEMKHRMEAAGLSMGKDIHEPPDHLSVELEYLYFLLEKGLGGKDQDATNEAASFALNTMVPWVTEFQQRLEAERECPFYSRIASVLLSILHFIGSLGESP